MVWMQVESRNYARARMQIITQLPCPPESALPDKRPCSIPWQCRPIEMPLGGYNIRRRQRLFPQNPPQRITFPCTRHQKYLVARRIQCAHAQRNTLGGRLGSVEYRHDRRRACRRRVIRKQAGGMPVFTHAQQRHIQAFNISQHRRIMSGSFTRAQFSRNGVDIARRDGDMLQQSIKSHLVVTLRIASRQTTLIAEINLHMRPVNSEVTQFFIAAARRFAAGQRDMKYAARSYRLRRQFCNALRDRSTQLIQIVMHKDGLRVRQIGDIHVALLASCAARKAVPSSASRSFKITLTGMASSNGRMRPLFRNASRNVPPCNSGRIFGAMPPPRYKPPRLITLSARLPASAPYRRTNRRRGSTH